MRHFETIYKETNKMRNIITREEAIRTLVELCSSGILNDEIQDKLDDIANCIECEQYGLHMWGSTNKDYATLFTAKRADLITDEDIAKKEEAINKHTFVPAPAERAKIEEYIAGGCEEDETD